MQNYRFDHIHLYTRDPEATAAWYERMLGAEVIRSNPGGKPRVDLKIGGANIFLLQVENVNTGLNSLDHFGFVVDDVDAAIADLRAKGVEVTMEPNTVRPGTRISFIRSPDGGGIEILSLS